MREEALGLLGAAALHEGDELRERRDAHDGHAEVLLHLLDRRFRAFLPTLLAVERDDETFVLHFPHYDLGSGPASAIYRGDFKLVRRYEDDRDLLFDLRRDPGERRDLAGREQKLAAELRAALDDYLQAIGAKMPTANPDYGK